jgi:hypothetical protein
MITVHQTFSKVLGDPRSWEAGGTLDGPTPPPLPVSIPHSITFSDSEKSAAYFWRHWNE